MQDRGTAVSLNKEDGTYNASVKGGYRHKRESVSMPEEVIEAAHNLVERFDNLVQVSMTEDGTIESTRWGAKVSTAHYTLNLTPIKEAVSDPLSL